MPSTNRSALGVLLHGTAELDLKVDGASMREFSEALAEAKLDALTTMTQKVGRSYMTQMKSAHEKVALAARKEIAAQQAMEEKGIDAAEKSRREAIHRLTQQATKDAGKEYKIQLANHEKIFARRKKAFKEISRTEDYHKKSQEKIKDRFTGTVGDLAGGNFESLTDKLSRAFSKVGKDMLKKAGPGEAGGALGGLGSMLAKLGPAIATFGALAMGFIAVAKVLIDADARVKDFNKSLFEAGLSVEDFVGANGQLEGSVQSLYDAYASTGPLAAFRREMNLSEKDLVDMQGAFSKSGLSVKDLNGGISNLTESAEALEKNYRTVAQFSRLFGVSLGEMATSVAEWHFSLGENLQSIREGFQNVFAAAMESGFGLKRFYGMVEQITSGMSMYNVRLSETAGLLSKVGKIIGPEGGKNFVQALQTDLREMSVLDREKLRMTAGAGVSSQILDKEAMRSASSFISRMQANPEEAAKLAAAMQAAGFGGAEGTAEGFMTALQKMSGSQRQTLRGSMGENSIPELLRLQDLADRNKGELGQARAIGAGGAGASLAFGLQRLTAVMGGDLSKLEGLDAAAFEEITGIKGKSGAEWRAIATAVADRAASKGMSMTDAAMTYGQELDDKSRAMSEAQNPILLAQKQIEATKSVSDMLSNVISQYLARIQDILSKILNAILKFVGSDTPREDIYSGADAQHENGRKRTRNNPAYKRALTILKGTGHSQPEKFAEALITTDWDQESIEQNRALFDSNPDLIDLIGVAKPGSANAQKFNSGWKLPPANDLVMQVGSNGVKFAQRVSPDDVGVFSKKGGAIDQASRRRSGGSGTNIFHLYGEGASVLNTIVRAQQAGVLGN